MVRNLIKSASENPSQNRPHQPIAAAAQVLVPTRSLENTGKKRVKRNETGNPVSIMGDIGI